MLRAIFGEPKRRDDGTLADVNRSIAAFCHAVRHVHEAARVESRWIRLDLWAGGLVVALNELEQSLYASGKYADRVWPHYEDELSSRERDDYYRHVYYFKNGLIRLFSILDKTGYFLDLLLALETGKVKNKFSYFTVLRQMHVTNTHAKLEQPLFDLKVKYREPLDRLRKKRNLEIHAMNAELIDDMWQTKSRFADRRTIENIADNMADLGQCYRMVTESLHIVFIYCTKMVKER